MNRGEVLLLRAPLAASASSETPTGPALLSGVPRSATTSMRSPCAARRWLAGRACSRGAGPGRPTSWITRFTTAPAALRSFSRASRGSRAIRDTRRSRGSSRGRVHRRRQTLSRGRRAEQQPGPRLRLGRRLPRSRVARRRVAPPRVALCGSPSRPRPRRARGRRASPGWRCRSRRFWVLARPLGGLACLWRESLSRRRGDLRRARPCARSSRRVRRARAWERGNRACAP